jgi:hypothetical protein
MANTWSKAVGIIHKKKYNGKPLTLAMNDPETRTLYAQLKGKPGMATGKMRKNMRVSKKNRRTRRR